MELTEGGLKSPAGFGQRIGDPRRRTGMHCALDNPLSFKLPEAPREQPIRHPRDSRAELAEIRRALDQRPEDDPGPPLADQLDRGVKVRTYADLSPGLAHRVGNRVRGQSLPTRRRYHQAQTTQALSRRRKVLCQPKPSDQCRPACCARSRSEPRDRWAVRSRPPEQTRSSSLARGDRRPAHPSSHPRPGLETPSSAAQVGHVHTSPGWGRGRCVRDEQATRRSRRCPGTRAPRPRSRFSRWRST